MITDAVKKYVYHEEPGIVLLHGDCREIMPQLAPESVQCCVTSPPYWGLRDYGVSGQMGLEPTLEEYVARMRDVFEHVRAALRPDGTLWLNLGDSYASGGRKERDPGQSNMHPAFKGEAFKDGLRPETPPGLKPKDLVGVPWRVAFALQSSGMADPKACLIIERILSDMISAYGDEPIPEKALLVLDRLRSEYAEAKGTSWYLRSDIIWHKPNPMPESVTDRPTKAHEYLFLLSKSERYYYDHEAIREPFRESSIKRAAQDIEHQAGSTRAVGKTNGPMKMVGSVVRGANKRTVWTVATKPYKGAHFATYPPELIEPCILAGSRPGDVVLDLFNGSGTTGQVCKRLGRRYIGIELNASYLALNEDRIGRQGVLV